MQNLKKIRSRIRKYDFILYLSFFLGIFFISSLYTKSIFLRTFLSFVAGIPPTYCLKRFYQQYQNKNNRQILGYFLQLLTAEITSGKTMLMAYQESCENLVSIIGQRSFLTRILVRGNLRLKAQIPVAETFKQIAESLKDQDGKTVFSVLAEQLKIGGEIDSLLRFSHVMIQDINETEKQIDADNNKQTLEAFILATIPFTMALFLKLSAPSFFNEAQTHLAGKIALILSFLFAIAATSLTFFFAGSGFDEQAKIKVISENKTLTFFHERKLTQIFGPLMMKYLPNSVLLRWQNQSQQLGMNPRGTNQEKVANQLLLFCGSIPILFLLSLPLTIVFVSSGILPWPLFPLPGGILILIQITQKKANAQRCQNSIIQSFPIFSGMMLALLKSGFTPQLALAILCRLLSNAETVLGREFMLLSEQTIETSHLLAELGQIAKSCNVPEIQATLNLIIQYSKTGNPDALTLLKIQTDICWQLARNKLKKAKEASSMRVLLPMMLNLVSIIILCAAPVVSRFSGS